MKQIIKSLLPLDCISCGGPIRPGELFEIAKGIRNGRRCLSCLVCNPIQWRKSTIGPVLHYEQALVKFQDDNSLVRTKLDRRGVKL